MADQALLCRHPQVQSVMLCGKQLLSGNAVCMLLCSKEGQNRSLAEPVAGMKLTAAASSNYTVPPAPGSNLYMYLDHLPEGQEPMSCASALVVGRWFLNLNKQC